MNASVGGQKQRVAIAHALVHDRACWSCDEPDCRARCPSGRNVMELLRKIAVRPGPRHIVTHENRSSIFGTAMGICSDGRGSASRNKLGTGEPGTKFPVRIAGR